jgi:hypothetical protein
MDGQYIFLDDIRNPWSVTHVKIPFLPYKIVRNYNEFVKAITAYYNAIDKLPEFITFDHDLCDQHYRPSMYDPDEHYSEYYDNGTFTEKTGYCCAKWLVEFCMEKNLDFPEYFVHSMNPIGKENIISLVESYKKSRTL